MYRRLLLLGRAKFTGISRGAAGIRFEICMIKKVRRDGPSRRESRAVYYTKDERASLHNFLLQPSVYRNSIGRQGYGRGNIFLGLSARDKDDVEVADRRVMRLLGRGLR